MDSKVVNSEQSNESAEKEVRVNKGGRKLAVLTVIAIFISLSLTTVSLAIYHYSGDIYLDRSRPGYLPDTQEVKTEEEDEEGDYKFEKSGALTREVLDEYLKKLEIEVEALDQYQNPFDDNALSDEHFGLNAN